MDTAHRTVRFVLGPLIAVPADYYRLVPKYLLYNLLTEKGFFSIFHLFQFLIFSEKIAKDWGGGEGRFQLR
jgi:hypothetical protein